MDVSKITVKVFQDRQNCDQNRKTLEEHINVIKREIIELKDDLYSLKQTSNENTTILALNNFTKTTINSKCQTITNVLGQLFSDVREMKNRINHIAEEDQTQINTYNSNKEICSKIKAAYEKNVESLEILHKNKENDIISDIKVVQLEIEELNMLSKEKMVQINEKYENIALIETELKKIAEKLEIKRKENHLNEELFKNKRNDNEILIEDLEKSTEPIKNSFYELQNNLQVLVHELIESKKNIQAIENEINQLQDELQNYNKKCLHIETLLLNNFPTNNLKLRKISKIIEEHENNYVQELETQNYIQKEDDFDLKLKELIKDNDTIEKESKACIEIELSLKKDFEKISSEIEELTLKSDKLTKSVFETEKQLSLKNNELFRIRSTATAELKVSEEKIQQLESECNTKSKLEDEMSAVRATNKEIQDNIAEIKQKIEENEKKQKNVNEENLQNSAHLKTINMQIVNISNEITKLESAKQNLTPHPPFKTFLQPEKPVSHKRKIVEESDDSSVEGEKVQKITYKQFIAMKKGKK